ncbi:MAG: Gfo/Idh/MocA family oxidoreductase [Bacteroidota bacterium]|jgi:predicted dehydrogenase|nr:Gfo/Idh/MocA family oxidoreductase [Bacteroidota bacterium]HPV17993.1 Gfo/Idh/MocA family oxidoreductase [Prolixibacteraceae bacterium]
MEESRRSFIRKAALGSAGIALGSRVIGGIAPGFSSRSYGNILGANEKIRVGVVGFSDRFRHSLLPGFMDHAGTLNFEMVALSDIWNRRREEGKAFIKEKSGWEVALCRNNEELYDRKDVDAVIISTADFQHALHLAEAARAGKDAYVEKPFAETMDDANGALRAVREAGIVVQVGSQRRSAPNYSAADAYIKSGKFGEIVMVEMSWNVNQPGRWRRPALCNSIKESDTDWKRYQMNRPSTPWDPRKYLEYRLFWPYSSGIPGQWMCHQIDTVHWFTGLAYPRSVVANGGIYQWRDGRTNADTLTAVFDYGSVNDPSIGFQVVYSSRFSNSAGGTKELYFSNGGMLNLDTNMVTPEGGLRERDAAAMNMKPNLLTEYELPKVYVETAANTSGDSMTSAHMFNWMDCVRSRKQTNAPVEAGYNHSVACIMANAAFRTGVPVTFDPNSKQVKAGRKVFKY